MLTHIVINSLIKCGIIFKDTALLLITFTVILIAGCASTTFENYEKKAEISFNAVETLNTPIGLFYRTRSEMRTNDPLSDETTTIISVEREGFSVTAQIRCDFIPANVTANLNESLTGLTSIHDQSSALGFQSNTILYFDNRSSHSSRWRLKRRGSPWQMRFLRPCSDLEHANLAGRIANLLAHELYHLRSTHENWLQESTIRNDHTLIIEESAAFVWGQCAALQAGSPITDDLLPHYTLTVTDAADNTSRLLDHTLNYEDRQSLAEWLASSNSEVSTALPYELHFLTNRILIEPFLSEDRAIHPGSNQAAALIENCRHLDESPLAALEWIRSQNPLSPFRSH